MPQASHVNHATGTGASGVAAFNVTRPTGADVAGRFVMVFMNSDTGVVGDMTLSAVSSPATTTGATWNVGGSYTLTSDGQKIRVFWKITNATEPATWRAGKQSGADTAWTAVCAQDVDTSSTPQFTPTSLSANNATSTTITTLGATPLGTDDLEYRAAFSMHGSATRSLSSITGTPSFTLTPNIQSTNFPQQRAGYRQLTSGSATGNETATWSATTPNRFAITVNLKSASAPPITANLGWAEEDDAANSLDVTMGLAADLGWASEEDAANSIEATITLPLEAILEIAIEQDVANTLTHRGGQPPPAPPPLPPRDTQDPRMPYVQCEIGFVTDASVQGYLVLDDPERGLLDVGKLAPGGGASIGGEIFEDVSRYLSSVTTRQGATRVESPLIRYEAGDAQAVLRNEDRRFDPTNLDGPYVVGTASSDTSALTLTCTKGLLRTWGVTIGVRSHASTGPASVRDVSAMAAGGSSATLTKPPGTTTNDYMIAINLSDYGTAGDIATPTTGSGASWGTPLVSQGYGTNRGHLKIWGKYANASEPASYDFNKHAWSDSTLAIITIRDVALASVPVIEFELVSSTALVETPAIVPLTPNDIEIRLAGGVASGGTLASWVDMPGGLVKRVDLDSNGYATMAVGTRVLTAIGSGESQIVPMRPIRYLATWGSTTNMVPNPSIEDGDITGWVGNSSSEVVASSTWSIYGRWSMRLKKLTDNVSHVVQATATWADGSAADGDVVTGSFWVFVPGSAYDDLTSFVIRGLDEFGNEAAALGSVGKPRAANRWERLHATAPVSPGEVLFGMRIEAVTTGLHANGSILAYIDGVQMIKGSKLEPFTNNVKRYPLWQGFVDQWDVAWDGGNGPLWSEVTVPASDAFKVFENIDRLPSSPQGAGEDTGSRLNRILDTVFWPNDLRDIAIGDSTLQETLLEGTVLSELQHALDSELGEGYLDGSGKFVFRNRNAVITEERSTTPQAIFGDDHHNPQELPWENLGVSTDDAQLVNKVSIGRAGGEVQVVEDAASQAKFLIRTHNREDLLLETDGEALGYANWILALSRKPELRFDSMEISPLKDPWRLFPQVLERRIGDRIQIIRRPPGGGDPIIRDVIIRGITHEIGQVHWKTTWQFQSADKYSTVVPF